MLTEHPQSPGFALQHCKNPVWPCTLETPTLCRWRQEDQKLKVVFNNIEFEARTGRAEYETLPFPRETSPALRPPDLTRLSSLLFLYLPTLHQGLQGLFCSYPSQHPGPTRVCSCSLCGTSHMNMPLQGAFEPQLETLTPFVMV